MMRGASRGRWILLLVSVLVAVAAASLILSGIFGGGPITTKARPGVPLGKPCADLTEPSPVALTTPLMAQVARREANADLYVSSHASRSLRLTVRIDGEVAYDAVAPRADDCKQPPIYRSSYQLPARDVAVEVRASDGRTESKSFRAGPHRWLLVLVQDGFPLGLEVWMQRPSFG
jgi:hypothetical protein